jgi:ferredoxin-NADP reductase
MREKPGGTVTGALFAMVRKLLSVGRNDLLNDMRPLGILVGFVGISGEFVLPEMVVAAEKGSSVSTVQLWKPLLITSEVTEKRLVWAAGGIGITPFLAMLNGLVSSSNSDSSSWSINLAFATREPEVMIPLLGEALSRVKPSHDAGSKMRIKLVVDVFSQTSIPDFPRAGDEEGKDWVKVELRPHGGRMGTAFFDALAKEQGEGVGFADMDAYVCGPDEFEKMVVDALVALGAERGRIRQEGFTY